MSNGNFLNISSLCVSYYPFGSTQEGLGFVDNALKDNDLVNKYLFGGKEQDSKTGFFEYHYRQYDSWLGRWHVVDPMAEMYGLQSPYHFAGNNPINNMETNGATYYMIPGLWDDIDSRDADGAGDGGGGKGTFDGFTTNNTKEIANLLSFIFNGGSLDNYNFNSDTWASTLFSNENDYGIIVVGRQDFIDRTNSALDRIGASKLGDVALTTLGKGVPLHIYSYDLAPESLKEESGGLPFYLNNSIYMMYMEDMPAMAKMYGSVTGDKELPSEDFLLLGHEVWHAYLDRIDPDYDSYTQHYKEKAAVGFENYLANVYEVDHVRRVYNVRDGSGKELWKANVQGTHFNPYGEKVYQNLSWTITNNPRSQWANSLTSTPVPYHSSDFYFYALPFQPFYKEFMLPPKKH
jgi:RHS repeat-associated protein